MSKNNEDTFQKVIFGKEAHDEMLVGASILAKAVRSTLGPSGHSIIIDNGVSAPYITKDGVTVARSINLKNKLWSTGAELLKEVAAKTNELVGDSTTTATVLAYGLLEFGLKMINSGCSAIALKRGMDIATKLVIQSLKANTISVRDREDIINVGTISANGARNIGELLADAIDKVGQDGIITIEPTKSINTTLEVVEGMQFENGFLSPYFVTNQEKFVTEFNDPYVLITNRKISTLQEIVSIVEAVANERKSLLIIADELDGEALHTLIVNKVKGVIFSCAVKAPSFGDHRIDLLSDIALVTGGTVFDASNPNALKTATIKQLGTASRIVVTKNSTTIVGKPSEQQKADIKERVQQIKEALEGSTLDDIKRANYKKRLAKLAGGIAVIKVGGSTEVEIFEKRDRVEDALNATLAAVQEGIVPGGGTALYYASNDVEKLLNGDDYNFTDDEWAGIKVVLDVCKLPLKSIIDNTGKSSEVIMDKLLSMNSTNRYGYDAFKHEFCDLIEKGIIDPLRGPRLSLEFSESIISLVLACKAVIIEEEKE